MEEAAAVRQAASDALSDVVPGALRDTLDEYVAAGSFVPGVSTLLAARAVTGEDPEQLVEQAAGVQLIYDGLRLTRGLAHENPWEDPETPGGVVDSDGAGEPDLSILAADVLVARGFYLLARTEASGAAVEVVRSFGRDQTMRESADDRRASELDRNLEADVLELAVTTGVTAAGGRLEDPTRLAMEFAPDVPGFASAGTFFDDDRRERLTRLASDGGRPMNRTD